MDSSKKELISSSINRYFYQWMEAYFLIKQHRNHRRNKSRSMLSSNSFNSNNYNYNSNSNNSNNVKMIRISSGLKLWGCHSRNYRHRTLELKSKAVYQLFKIQGETCQVLHKKLTKTKANFSINDAQQPLI